MNCAKCGKKTENESMFCLECLEEMKRYPIKPGTTVHIPVRPETAERKQTRTRKERTPEEQIAFLHKLVRWMALLIAVLATGLTLTVGALVYTIAGVGEDQSQELPMGRNYTTSGTTDNP